MRDCRAVRLERQYDRFKNWLADGCDGGLEYLRPEYRQTVRSGGALRRRPFGDRLPGSATTAAVGARGGFPHRFLCAFEGLPLTIRDPMERIVGLPAGTRSRGVGRVFTDTAPLAEKSWAVEAGLGWIGRNSLLANPRLGSFLLLGEVVTTAELEPDAPFVRDGCGTCRACVDACPVAAIRPDRTDRRGALHFPPDDRSRRRGRRRSARLAVRVRRMPKGLSLQPQSPGLRTRLFRTACRTGTVGRRRLVGIGRGRFPADFRRNTACPVRFAPPTRADTQAEVKPDGCRDVRFFACFGTKSGLPLMLTFCLITDCIRGEKKRKLGAGECL